LDLLSGMVLLLWHRIVEWGEAPCLDVPRCDWLQGQGLAWRHRVIRLPGTGTGVFKLVHKLNKVNDAASRQAERCQQ